MKSKLAQRCSIAILLFAPLLNVGCGSSKPAPKIIAPEASTSAQSWEQRADVKDLALGEVLEVPYILWGGDVATFVANGGETTRPGSAFAKQNLKIKLVRGDDFSKQLQNYKDGKTPFLRGTLSMIGQASDQIGGDPRSHPVVFLQMTWSAGDHLVARTGINTLSDLKGKTLVLQKGGPHVGMLNDILHTAQLGWNDIKIVWVDEVTGDKGPAELFRKDSSIDACFAITPDMLNLTGGPDATGTGEKKTVKGAHVLVSTAQMMRSIADVYACRKDFFEKHKDQIEQFTAAYLKGCEELLAIKKASKDKPASYKEVLTTTRKMFGADVGSDDEADGLISDAVFVGLPGNYSFFQDKGNLSGFDSKARAAVDLALSLKDATNRHDLMQGNLDYAQIKKIGDLSAKLDPMKVGRFSANAQEKGVIYSFNVYFGGNRSDFPEAQYGNDFKRAVEQASLFGHAMISIRGHANASDLMEGFRSTALKRGIVTQRGNAYFRKDGTEFAMNDMRTILESIEKDKLGDVVIPVMGGRPTKMHDIVRELQVLSEKRSAAVREAVLHYATQHGFRLDPSQMKFVGVGGAEPVVMFPPTDNEGGKNRRVEFRLIAISAEGIASEEYDF